MGARKLTPIVTSVKDKDDTPTWVYVVVTMDEHVDALRELEGKKMSVQELTAYFVQHEMVAVVDKNFETVIDLYG